MSTTFDLFNLNLSTGTHSITVISKAGGYADSAESKAVSYGAVADELPGTWILNNSLDNSLAQRWNVYFTYEFDGKVYDGRVITQWNNPNDTATNSNNRLWFTLEGYGSVMVYENTSFIDGRGRIFNITCTRAEVTNGDTLLMWLKANATKTA